jgi:predicted Rdx family selenoprotein
MKKFMTLILMILCIACLVGVAYAVDPTYGPKVYKTDGGDREVVASGGTIEAEPGGFFMGTAFKAATHVYTTLADWTLSAAEMICNLLVTSSGSGSTAIIAPDVAGRLYIVRNGNTAGGTNAITIKINGGTGVAIANGKTAVVIHNGTDYVRVTADATN